jgi:hypothetical protein
MASNVQIANRALQLLGAARITALSDDTVNGRECNAVFDQIREAELRSHTWNFAITRTQLAADATAPAFGRAREFPLPSDCLRVLPPYPEEDYNTRDWRVEGRSIYTNDSDPLDLRYVKGETDPARFDALFAEAFAHSLALAMCEKLTQSRSLRDRINAERDKVYALAKKTNAIENVPQRPVEDEWVTARL